MGFYPVAVVINKTQHTNNTHHIKYHHDQTKHSTQYYTHNKGHTIHNEYK
jgi:hypothetical protein